MRRTLFSTLLAAALWPATLSANDEWDAAIGTILSVGPEGEGNAAAAEAHRVLTAAPSSVILPILHAMDGSGPVAQNWLRGAVEIVFSQQDSGGDSLAADLEGFIGDTGNAPRARELAFDLYEELQPEKAASLIPGMANDPSNALRRRAVALLLEEGQSLAEDASEKEAAVDVLTEALDVARDIDQVEAIAKLLEDKLGQDVDLPRQFGFLLHWHLAAPFDNTGREGFTAVYPPEESVDLETTYTGKDDTEVAWQPFASTDRYGKVDFNKPFPPLKEVTGYAYTTFQSAEERPAQLRLGCKNAWKIWLNGQLVFGRDEYHRGQRIDQYILPMTLKEGDNTILVKACQNEQEQDWTVQWEFQLRVTDETGAAILSTDRKPTPKEEEPERRRG